MNGKKQPPALTRPDLEEFRAAVAEAARAPLLERIAEMECQLSAVGAGGVEPLRKPAAQPSRECLQQSADKARAVLTEIVGCFDAAGVEGLDDALVNNTDARLADLVQRRFLPALYAAIAEVTHGTAPEAPAQVGLVAAARDFYNATVGDKQIRISAKSPEASDSITRLGETLRFEIQAALQAAPPAPAGVAVPGRAQSITDAWEAIGYHSAQVASTGDCAPGNRLIYAMAALESQLAAAPAQAKVSQDHFAPAQEHATQLAGQGPTTEELMELSRECAKMRGGRGMYYQNYARAVLARWGAAPAQAQEDARELYKAAKAWVDLKDKIRAAGRPPHTDFWHQSIDETDKALRAAIDAARAAQGGAA